MEILVLLPDQLYLDDTSKDFYKLFNTIILIEEPKHFMTKFAARYRASMKIFYNALTKLGLPVKYISYQQSAGGFINYLANVQAQVNMFFPIDFLQWGDDIFTARFYGLPIKFYDSSGYLITRKELLSIIKSKHWANKSSRRQYIHRKLGQQYPFINSSEKNINIKENANDAIWNGAIIYARSIHKEIDISRVPLDHDEAVYALAINDYRSIKWALHIGLLTPAIILARTNVPALRTLVYDREYDRIISEAGAKIIKIKHRRYEVDGLI